MKQSRVFEISILFVLFMVWASIIIHSRNIEKQIQIIQASLPAPMICVGQELKPDNMHIYIPEEPKQTNERRSK